MNIESLKTFIALAEVGNFKKAAQQLFVVQSTVSARIQELENLLGQKLFIRSGKGLELTSAGYFLLPYARQIAEIEQDMYQSLHYSSAYKESLSIGASDTIYDSYIAHHISDFLDQYPSCSLSVIHGSSMQMLNLLHDHKIDICFSYTAFSDKFYHSRLLASDELLLVTSPDNPRWPDGITLERFLSLPIYFSDFFMVTKELQNWYLNIFPANYVFQLNIDIIHKLVDSLVQGKGYGFVPKSAVKKALREGKLIEIKYLFPNPPSLDCYVTVWDNQMEENKIKRLLQIIEGELS